MVRGVICSVWKFSETSRTPSPQFALLTGPLPLGSRRGVRLAQESDESVEEAGEGFMCAIWPSVEDFWYNFASYQDDLSEHS